MTVFINDVAFEVVAEPFNVQAAFGNDAVLINAAGQPVVTNEWGLTLQPLQHGAFYYLVGAVIKLTKYNRSIEHRLRTKHICLYDSNTFEK